MVYLEGISGKFPKVQPGTVNSIKFIHQVNKQEYTPKIKKIVDKGFYYEVEFEVLPLTVGQYDYYLLSSGNTLGSGICQYGDYTTDKTEYQQNIKITSYDRGN